jgi:3D (Asp-Asp-Asp) domain-containing protein
MMTSDSLNTLRRLPLRLRPAMVALSLLTFLAPVGWVATPKSGRIEPSRGARPLDPSIPCWSLDGGLVRIASPSAIHLFRLPITVTGYSSTPDQTDDTPFITAANTPVRPGVLALSRDLLREFTPGAPFRFGDRVELEGIGVFVVEDTMHPRFTRRADIWFTNREAARQWGRQNLRLAQLGPAAPEQDLFAAAGDWLQPAEPLFTD